MAEPEGKALDFPVHLLPTLTYCQELWVGTKRMRLQMQMAEMWVLRQVAELNLRDT